MRKTDLLKGVSILLGLAAVGLFASTAVSSEGAIPRVPKEMLLRHLDNAEVYVLDVRTEEAWRASEFKIKGALREDPGDFNFWVQKYRDNQAYVLYCDEPDEDASAALVQRLRDKNYSKTYALKGGWREWLEAGYPVERK
jgi:rhodanese-related sulfurtransferase